MRVTMREIAQRSGVSVQTVSQILNDKGHLFRSDTRERVLQTARALRYRPSANARAVRSGQTLCVALLLSEASFKSMLTRELLDGICEALSQHDMHLVVARFPDEELSPQGEMPRMLREWMSDGLLINYNAEIPDTLRDAVAECGLPAVWINSQQKTDCVFPDDLPSAEEATQYLLELGHQRIAYVDYQEAGHYSRFARQQGYLSVMEQAQKVPQVFSRHRMPPHFNPSERGWLQDRNRPTAVLCYGPETARLVAHEALLEGLQIPDDLSIMTFSAEWHCHFPLGFDSMRLPHLEMGRCAVEMLFQKMSSPHVCLEPCAVPLVRQTIAGTTQVLR
jgi:LacI family transcriptional regulator